MAAKENNTWLQPVTMVPSNKATGYSAAWHSDEKAPQTQSNHQSDQPSSPGFPIGSLLLGQSFPSPLKRSSLTYD